MFLAVAACLLLCSCGSSYGDRLVRHEIQDFHAAYNEGRYAEIYRAADEQMRKTGTEEQFTNFLASVNQEFGKVVSSRNDSWDMRVNENRREVVLFQATQFERGSGRETFIYVLVEGKAHLLGYRLKMGDEPKEP